MPVQLPALPDSRRGPGSIRILEHIPALWDNAFTLNAVSSDFSPFATLPAMPTWMIPSPSHPHRRRGPALRPGRVPCPFSRLHRIGRPNRGSEFPDHVPRWDARRREGAFCPNAGNHAGATHLRRHGKPQTRTTAATRIRTCVTADTTQASSQRCVDTLDRMTATNVTRSYVSAVILNSAHADRRSYVVGQKHLDIEPPQLSIYVRTD